MLRFGAIVTAIFALAGCSTNTYWGRVVWWNVHGMNDTQLFPGYDIPASKRPYRFRVAVATKHTNALRYLTSIEKQLLENETRSFVVIKNGELLYQQYFNSYKHDDLHRSFSTSKSITSTLLAIYLSHRWIQSLQDPVHKYIELPASTSKSPISLQDVLDQRSGIYYREGSMLNPWNHYSQSYYTPKMSKAILKLKADKIPPGKRFQYSDFNTSILGAVLHAATRNSFKQAFYELFWDRLGSEYSCRWSIFSDNDLEMFGSGFNVASIDYAKFGQMILNEGFFNGRQIVPKSWVRELYEFKSLKGTIHPGQKHHKIDHLGYHNQWWQIKSRGRVIIYAQGGFGQYILINPVTKVVIVRHGSNFGDFSVSELVNFLVETSWQVAVTE